jgi:hypothetical protein
MSLQKLPPLVLLTLVCGAPTLAADTTDEGIQWKKPIVRTVSMMAVGLAGLHALGETDSDPSLDNFQSAFRSGPEPDDDSDFYNLVLHPVWGSETYLRAREANMGMWGSVGFSMGSSITWEYLFESWTEHPSQQDLIYTTGLGWMLGEFRYRLKLKTGKKAHWWIDPIDMTLEHMRVGFTKDRRGDDVPTVILQWNF